MEQPKVEDYRNSSVLDDPAKAMKALVSQLLWASATPGAFTGLMPDSQAETMELWYSLALTAQIGMSENNY